MGGDDGSGKSDRVATIEVLKEKEKGGNHDHECTTTRCHQ
jgi:hypothetical protein